MLSEVELGLTFCFDSIKIHPREEIYSDQVSVSVSLAVIIHNVECERSTQQDVLRSVHLKFPRIEQITA